MVVSITPAVVSKYPFINEAATYVQTIDLNLQELLDETEETINSDYVEIFNRARERIIEALLQREVTWKKDVEIEIFSFPIAILLVSIIQDTFLARRYALAEATRSLKLLLKEDLSLLIEIANSSLKWKVQPLESDHLSYDCAIHFTDYLSIATHFQSDKWKLINRYLQNGHVYLIKDELARLISEEANTRMYTRIQSSPQTNLQDYFTRWLDPINQILTKIKSQFRRDELPKAALEAAYPPCIKRLNDALLDRHHLSHMGRFTLTSFLLNVNISIDDLVKLYLSVSDFDERHTRYQIEHIAGKKGSGTKYHPPKCRTLKTHSLCPGPDTTCQYITNPLHYYRRKSSQIGGVRATKKRSKEHSVLPRK
jgi:DNA primase large subunit